MNKDDGKPLTGEQREVLCGIGRLLGALPLLRVEERADIYAVAIYALQKLREEAKRAPDA